MGSVPTVIAGQVKHKNNRRTTGLEMVDAIEVGGQIDVEVTAPEQGHYEEGDYAEEKQCDEGTDDLKKPKNGRKPGEFSTKSLIFVRVRAGEHARPSKHDRANT